MFRIDKKKKFSCVGEVFPIDRGLLMGDPFRPLPDGLTLIFLQEVSFFMDFR